MKIRSVLLGAAAAIALGAAGAVLAAPAAGIGVGGTSSGHGGCSQATPGQAKGNCGAWVKAPEIDAAAGVQAVALLSGIMLLLGERARRTS